MDEFELIERFFRRESGPRPDVLLGIGDDAAVTTLDANGRLVIATDTIVAGTHFPVGTQPRAIGHRCLAVNLSDLAAMGAEPLWCTLALSLPNADTEWVAAFAEGFFELAGRFNVALVGGDTVRGPLAVTVTAHGRTESEKYVMRSGAANAEGIYVTGYPGEAAAGLQLLQAANTAPADDRWTQRFLYPQPRVHEGQSLVGLATAMIDISDGLQVDLQRLLQASGVGADIDMGKIPVSPDALEAMDEKLALDLALTGGDDYELCFTVPADREPDLNAIRPTWDCPVTRIGDTRSAPGILWSYNGHSYDVPDTSFRHF